MTLSRPCPTVTRYNMHTPQLSSLLYSWLFRLASTRARRSSGSNALACAAPAGAKPRCSNQSAVRVVSSTRRWMPSRRASLSARRDKGARARDGDMRCEPVQKPTCCQASAAPQCSRTSCLCPTPPNERHAQLTQVFQQTVALARAAVGWVHAEGRQLAHLEVVCMVAVVVCGWVCGCGVGCGGGWVVGWCVWVCGWVGAMCRE